MAGMRTAGTGRVRVPGEGRRRGRAPQPGRRLLGLPFIVGSGPNATILHYPEADRQMQAGELLLVDAAANYGYQASDITRTYPVSGTFTPPQRDIYELVLHAQDEAIKVARPGATLATIHSRAVEVLKEGLLEARASSPTPRASSTRCGSRTARRTTSASTCTTSAAATSRCSPA